MGRKQTKRQQRRAKKEEGKKKKNTATENDEGEVQNRNGWNDDDKDGGKETLEVQNRIEHAEDLGEKNMTGFRVTVPENSIPGEEFQVYVGSRIVRVRCPLNWRPGQSLQITVPDDEEIQHESFYIPRIDDRNEYPTSDEYRRAMELYSSHNINDMQEAVGMYYRLAVEVGCVRSMYDLGSHFSKCDQAVEKFHVATPWLLEGAIRGSGGCRYLLATSVYEGAKPKRAYALHIYWLKMYAKFNTCNYDEIQFDNSMIKQFENSVSKSCGMCLKTDSKTLVLKQCKGCSLHCYCSETCQTAHWEEDNHRGECKQLYILNKYHKPYAKEIRDAAISGTNHPALDKLRHKLGLSRPLQEYEDLMVHNTHDGKSIDIKDYLVGRDDGTVWMGSTPDPIGSYKKNASLDHILENWYIRHLKMILLDSVMKAMVE
jgi:hypothetical protein